MRLKGPSEALTGLHDPASATGCDAQASAQESKQTLPVLESKKALGSMSLSVLESKKTLQSMWMSALESQKSPESMPSSAQESVPAKTG